MSRENRFRGSVQPADRSIYIIYYVNNNYIVHTDHFHFSFALCIFLTHFVCSLWIICMVCIFVAEEFVQLFSLLAARFVFVVVHTQIENIFLWKSNFFIMFCYYITLIQFSLLPKRFLYRYWHIYISKLYCPAKAKDLRVWNWEKLL